MDDIQYENGEAKAIDAASRTRIWTDINRGCSKSEMFNRLLELGFARSTIVDELNFDPDDCFDVAPVMPRPAAGPGDSPAPVGIPIAQRVDVPGVELYTIDAFLDADECARLVSLIRQDCAPSKLSSPEPDKAFRTSRTCLLSRVDDSLIPLVDERICKAIGLNPSYGEGLQGQFYGPGAEFKPHTDYFADHEWARHCALQGQRTWTFMVFLNEVERGGATRFPEIGVEFAPRPGTAVIWNNLDTAGRPNALSLHHGTRVEAGEKFILTKWFRQRGEGVMVTRDPREARPRYTATGFSRRNVPEGLYRSLLEYYRAHRGDGVPEFVAGGFISGPGPGGNSVLIDLPDELKRLAHEQLQPVLEEWSGARLAPTFVYGIREYRRGARLWPHRDRGDTHLISASLTLDQERAEPWPLEIDDHVYRRHAVLMAPGEMLLYESLTLLHGRPQPLSGLWHADVFVHFALARERGSHAVARRL